MNTRALFIDSQGRWKPAWALAVFVCLATLLTVAADLLAAVFFGYSEDLASPGLMFLAFARLTGALAATWLAAALTGWRWGKRQAPWRQLLTGGAWASTLMVAVVLIPALFGGAVLTFSESSGA